MNRINSMRLAGAALMAAFASLIAAIVYGWCLNVVALLGASEFTVHVALRLLGVVIAPLGALLGYLG